jgi:Uncharacterized protein conserved in bacteria (DUF2255)
MAENPESPGWSEVDHLGRGREDAIYVRSAHSSGNGWFRRAEAGGSGRLRGGGIERDVTFAEPGRL